MSEAQFLELVTGLVKLIKPLHRNTVTVPDPDVEFKEIDIDSLDTLMIVIYCCELHGISEEVGKECNPKTARELWDFIQAHKTKDVTDVAAALEECK
jgi:acyl carrier protein